MLKRLVCYFVSHSWETKSVSVNPPADHPGTIMLFRLRDYHERYGFTEVFEECSRCHAKQITKLVGDHSQPKEERELEELRKMAGL